MVEDSIPRDRCSLCDDPEAKVVSMLQNDTSSTTCPNCGAFGMSWEAWRYSIKNMSVDDRSKLSALVKWRHIREQSVPFFFSEGDSLPETKGVVRVTPNEFLSKWPSSHIERFDRILLNIAERSPRLGSSVSYNVKEPAFFFALSKDEFVWIADFFSKTDWVSKQGHDSAGSFRLTHQGWKQVYSAQERLESLVSTQGFVAMDFDEQMKPLYDGPISAAINRAGFEPMRIDTKEFIGDIVDEIVVEIRRSRFLVAEMTYHNKGVYFEAGFAMGLNIPVIFACREDEMGKDKTHFDIEHLNHVIWKDEKDLQRRLELRIRATVL
jgi:nucleoside 2-deoxyribosyltransferase